MPMEYFEQRERALLGDRFDVLYAAPQETAERGVTVSALRSSPEQFAAKADFPLEASPFCKAAFVVHQPDDLKFRPGRHPYHHAGVFYSQEPSASSAAPLLGVQPGMRVLDMCAAPGGKSSQLAAALQGRGVLVSNEYVAARAEILKSNLERMGVSNAVVLNETPARIAEALPEFFDRVLVDAPCSGEGMFRKDETAVTEWSPENVRRCAGRQQEILENAAMMLKPGGRLVYSTCTFAPEEDEQAIGRFLEAHPEFALEETPDYSGLSHGVPAWGAGVTDGIEKTVRIWPHRTEGEGHYAALLRKTGEPESVKRKYPASMKDKKLLAVYEDFCKEIFIEPKKWTADSTMTMFGDQLYRTPEEMVDFKGLRVLRPGLQMGEFKKNRFEPSHALALALHPSEVKQNVNLSADAPETAAYLRGETIQLSEEDAGKGWCLVSVDGYSLGWGKKSGGTLKNHYPKGLRKQY